MDRRVCTTCSIDKPVDEYYKGYTSRTECKQCKKERANKRHTHSSYVFKKYGVDHDVLLKEHGGMCGICGTTESDHSSGHLVVDHCHATGEVRGLLCDSCNVLLGRAKDDTGILQSAINYLNG